MTIAPVLMTPRLRLRPHRISDFAALHAMWTSPEVYRHITGRPPTQEKSWARLLRYHGHWSMLGFGFWAVEDMTGGHFIGEMGFADFHREIDPPFGDTPEMGWALAPAFHRRGYGFEALSAVLAWGRNNLSAPRYACMISPANTASLALAARLGFEATTQTNYHGEPALILHRTVPSQVADRS